MTGGTEGAGTGPVGSDFLVVGAGIAGAAAAYFLSRHGAVTVLEAERAPGVHATGRSSGLFSEYYGNPTVRSLTEASRGFYTRPPEGFCSAELLHPRGVLALETPGSAEAFDEAKVSGARAPQPVVEVDPAEARRLCPALRPEAFGRALYKPGACDVDVDAAHQGFLRGARAAGGRIVTSARVMGLSHRRGAWCARTPAGEFTAPLLVDAAGAWSDELARLAGVPPAGLVPRRRTAALVPVPPHDDGRERGVADWPMVADVAGTFYGRPESGGLLLSPVDETPVPPGDVRPEDVDVALALERFTAVVDLPLRHVRRAWAGLRTSPADDVPLVGPAPGADGFHRLAGLGGYGIQTAPAAGALLAALVTGEPPPTGLEAAVPALSPARNAGSVLR
ncbi:NAD(P)/FAD-dependent oxidoreductase [Streptomyces sp. TR06-5]|uniref:NAD(P)/FAD-dependent oxidoreductase n=1 Tax=unclassified Streptomyces TaxID=2593676 RepID=UPI0039A1D557